MSFTHDMPLCLAQVASSTVAECECDFTLIKERLHQNLMDPKPKQQLTFMDPKGICHLTLVTKATNALKG